MSYDPRYHQRTSNLESEIAAYGEDALVVKQQRTNRPARHLGNTKQAIIAERLARQQAIDEARARQQNRCGNTRQPTDAYPQVRKRPVNQEDDEGEDSELYEDEELSTHSPRSAVQVPATWNLPKRHERTKRQLHKPATAKPETRSPAQAERTLPARADPTAREA